MRPLCIVCNRNLARKNYRKPGTFRKKCCTCSQSRAGAATGYRKHKKDRCENLDCPLTGIAYESYILDVDHADGNKANNDPANLVTLCCVCHRVKTFESKDYLNLKYRELV